MPYFLNSGEEVCMTHLSHLHETAKPYLLEALKKINSNSRVNINELVSFNDSIGFDYCIETNKNDNIIYAIRKGRNKYSRFVKNKEAKRCNSLIVILKKIENKNKYILITSYIGSSYRKNNSNKEEPEQIPARKLVAYFWHNHALIWGSYDIQLYTIIEEKEYLKRKHNKSLNQHIINSNENIIGILKSGETVIKSNSSQIEEAAEAYISEALEKVYNRNEDEINFTANLQRNIGLDYVVRINKKDKIFYAQSLDSKNHYRFVEDKKAILTSFLSVKLLRDEEDLYKFHLLKAYIGKHHKDEAWNSLTLNEEEKEISLRYWKHHAYVLGGKKITENTKSHNPPSEEE